MIMRIPTMFVVLLALAIVLSNHHAVAYALTVARGLGLPLVY